MLASYNLLCFKSLFAPKLNCYSKISQTWCKFNTMSSKSSSLVLYGDEASPPVRFVMITSSLLGIDFEFRNVDLFKEENRAEFYKKINPLHKVPALSVNGEVICDSHAISMYLCKMSPDQGLYPTDAIQQARVDQMLYFDATTLFPLDSAIYVQVKAVRRVRFLLKNWQERAIEPREYNDGRETEYFTGVWPADEVKVKQWYLALDHLERQLVKHKWLAGDKMHLCDICCAMTVTSLGILFPPLEQQTKVKQWLKSLDDLPCFEINRRGLDRLRSFVFKMDPSLKN